MALYALFTVSVTVLALLSVLAVHCGWTHAPGIRGPRIDARARSSAELRTCHRDLARLLSDLHDKTFSLQARALKYQTDPTSEWRNWSEAWRQRWRLVGYRCRLGEIAGTGVSAEIDRMEPVHSSLAELQLSYSEVVNRFVERYVLRLRELHKELSAIRAMIERRPPSRPDRHSRLLLRDKARRL